MNSENNKHKTIKLTPDEQLQEIAKVYHEISPRSIKELRNFLEKWDEMVKAHDSLNEIQDEIMQSYLDIFGHYDPCLKNSPESLRLVNYCTILDLLDEEYDNLNDMKYCIHLLHYHLQSEEAIAR